jgi:protein-S-isoprenylcysteine O-methyltransferase Ste14
VRHIQSPKGLSPTGVGPLIFVGQILLATAAAFAPPALPLPASPALRLLGVAWLAAGIVLWALTLRVFVAEFPEGELITHGTYRYSRNPLYASLIVFVIPAIGLIVFNAGFLIAAFLGAALAYPLVRREERDLERVYGSVWHEYRAHTSWLVPLPPRRHPVHLFL